MSGRSRLIGAGIAGLLLGALPALAKTAKPKTVPVESAVIENSGSTNTTGYKITVSSGGSAQVDGRTLVVPPAACKKLFADLAAALPLTGLPARRGMRSASFGTSTTITYKGQRSPDLTFGGDPRVAALKADIDAVTQALHVSSRPRRPAVSPPAPLPPTRN